MSAEFFTASDRAVFRFTRDGKTQAVDPSEIDRLFIKFSLTKGYSIADLMKQVYRPHYVEVELAKQEAERVRSAQAAGTEVPPLTEQEEIHLGIVRDDAELVSLEATRKLAEGIAQAFGFKLLGEDGEGWTTNEAYALLMHYTSWKNDIKKSSEATPDSSEPTDGPPVDSDQEEANLSDTSPTSD